MNNRFLLILAAIVVAICVGAIWFLQSEPPRSATMTPAPAPPVPKTLPPPPPPAYRTTEARPLPLRAESGTATTAKSPKTAPAQPPAEWEKKIDQILRADVDETATAQLLINILPTLPPDGQAEAAQHISNLLLDKDYGRVAPIVKNPNMPEEVLDVFVTDLMNRDDAVKLPVLLDIAKIPNHPHREESLSDLQIFLDEDYGTDWAKWEAAMKSYLAKQAAEEAADAANAAPPAPQKKMKIVVAATGASGAIYLQRLLDRIASPEHEIHLVLSNYARQVIQEELGELRLPAQVRQHGDKSMNVPFVSGSARFDAMVVVPCSMGTLSRIAAGTSETTILRAADVFLKERRTLILVPRETPWNLIHARNTVTLIEAGALIMPASPAFYSRPANFDQLADTVVERIIDQLGLPVSDAFRWAEDPE